MYTSKTQQDLNWLKDISFAVYCLELNLSKDIHECYSSGAINIAVIAIAKHINKATFHTKCNAILGICALVEEYSFGDPKQLKKKIDEYEATYTC